MTFARRRNSLTAHSSECIPIVKQRMTVYYVTVTSWTCFSLQRHNASGWTRAWLIQKIHVLFLSYDRNTGSCICLSLHLL